MIILALASGVVGLIVSAVLRNPKYGESARQGVVDDRFIYLSLPGFSLFLIGIGVLGLTVPGSGSGGAGPVLLILSVLAAAVTILGAIMSVWGLFGRTVPKWATPNKGNKR